MKRAADTTYKYQTSKARAVQIQKQKKLIQKYKYTNTKTVSNLPGRSWARAAFMLEVPVLKK